MYLFAQLWPDITSLTCATVTPGQLSEADTEAGAGAGTADAQDTVVFAGQVMDGAWLSTTVTVKLHESPLVAVAVTRVDPAGKKQSLQ